jgi:Ca2+-binding RTX toxin-like protein
MQQKSLILIWGHAYPLCLIQWQHLLDEAGGAESLARAKRKGKGLVRRTILILGTMVVMLVVAGGVALALQCGGGTCYGTNEGEAIAGTPDPDEIYALGGDDAINGYADNDYIDGGSGPDYVVGEDDNDTLHGGADNDGDVVGIYGGYGNDYLYGDAGNDFLDGEADYDVCVGGEGFDVATADCEQKISIEGSP